MSVCYRSACIIDRSVGLLLRTKKLRSEKLQLLTPHVPFFARGKTCAGF